MKTIIDGAIDILRSQDSLASSWITAGDGRSAAYDLSSTSNDLVVDHDDRCCCIEGALNLAARGLTAATARTLEDALIKPSAVYPVINAFYEKHGTRPTHFNENATVSQAIAALEEIR